MLFVAASFWAIVWIIIRCLREWEALRYDRTKTTRMQDTVEAAEEAVEGIRNHPNFYQGSDLPPPSDEELRGWSAMQSRMEAEAANAEAYPSTDVNEEHIRDETPPSVPPTTLYAQAWSDEV